MASRHLSRSIAMQSLYEWDFNGQATDTIEEIIGKNMGEFGPGLDDKDFPRQLVQGVLEKLPQLDTIIGKAAPEWPISQIAVVDRNVLRLGLWELLFGDHAAVPPKVAINEAIELAKSFGGESSGKFVNGVLGTVYRELGEPGKEHPKRGEARLQDLPDRQAGGQAMPAKEEDYVGAIVFRRDGEKILWAMIHDIFRHWTFVKGHKKPEETAEAGALREVKEEVGLDGKIISPLGQNSYAAKNESGEPVVRKVNYFLVEASDEKLTIEQGAGIVGAEWFPMAEVMQTKHYEDTNRIIDAAMKKLIK